jgi:hypothetical protein
LRFGPLACLGVRLQLRLRLQAHARSLRQRLIRRRARVRLGQAPRFGVRARARRLLRCLFCLDSCLRKAACTALGRGKLCCACFGLALGRKLRLGHRLGLLLGACTACCSLDRLGISLCAPARLLRGKLLGLRPFARRGFLFPLRLRATLRSLG